MVGKEEAWIFAVPTAGGEFYAAYSRAGLRWLGFPETQVPYLNDPLKAPLEVAAWHNATCQALPELLAGRVPTPRPPLDWAGATAFQRAVWEALMTIPPSEVRTYAEVARQIGRPRAARAVGAACARNPIPLLVPCHRVVAAGGKLGGFSAGLAWKQRLLAVEGHKNCHHRLLLC